ncbi:hypothetical protein [Ideonella sp. YS5]|uniref:hypothetical protein n=1 Tax=Ideonella sp. YS5 TaxID=3453714 RepID=UPI003EE9226E
MNEQGIPASVMTTYYVIPLKGDTDAPPPVNYYTADWVRVDDGVLDSSPNKNRTDFVRLVQPTFDQMQDHKIDLDTVDAGLTLFSGVAKTLNGSLGVPNLFEMSDGALVVPVARSSSRGLILIFARQNDGVTVDLVATGDPILRNGPDGLPGDLR